MRTEEFKFLEKIIKLECREELSSFYKIRSYKQKLKLMKERNIPQKEITDVLNHLFLKNSLLSRKTKNSISKIIYSKKDRIIVAITKWGKEIIWNRDKLIRSYGWFFFVSEAMVDKKDSDKKKKRKREKKKKKIKEEKTVNVEEFQFEDKTLLLMQKMNMRALYNTKEYTKYGNLIKSKKISQMEIQEVLKDLFFNNNQIPLREKKAISKIIYYQEEKVIVIKSLIGDKMYENLESLVERYGWYFYITGVPVGSSEISSAIDKIEKRFNQDYFKEMSLFETSDESKNPRVLLYPIVLKPNHNCFILGLGKLNILLDCGISEYDLEHVEFYLEKLDDLLKEKEKNGQEFIDVEALLNGNELEEIDNIKKFEDVNVDNALEKKEQEDLKSVVEPDNFNDETNANDFTKQASNERDFDAIFISHSHYDHISGLKDLVKLYPEIPILCSRITLDLYLLRDSNFLKQEKHEEIEEEDYRNIVRNVIYVENGDKIEFKEKDCFLSFFHAGHMPGALMTLARAKNYRFLYTGDYTYWDFSPFAGTRRFLEQISRPVDFLLIDTVCAGEDFGSPSDQLHSLILFLEQKTEYGNSSLIGADPSSLAISFMLTIWRHFRKLQLRKNFQKRPNIYVDMMVRKNIQVINHRYKYIYGPISKLIKDKANPFNSIKFRWFDRNNMDFLKTKNNIIITHPPDLSYGIIRPIISSLGRNPHNLVFLSGAIHEEPGLSLIDGAEEIKFLDTWKAPFRALLINRFVPDLKIKLHGDKAQLMEMIKNLEPKEVCLFHQSPRKLYDVAEEVRLSGVEKVSVPQKRTLIILN